MSVDVAPSDSPGAPNETLLGLLTLTRLLSRVPGGEDRDFSEGNLILFLFPSARRSATQPSISDSDPFWPRVYHSPARLLPLVMAAQGSCAG